MNLSRFAAFVIEDVCPLAQPLAKLVGLCGCAVASAFSLRGVAAPTVVPANKVSAWCVKHCYQVAVPGTVELAALGAQVAGLMSAPGRVG